MKGFSTVMGKFEANGAKLFTQHKFDVLFQISYLLFQETLSK